MTKQEATEIIKKVISLLHGDWSIDEINSLWQIKAITDDGRGLYFSQWDQQERFAISGAYPQFNDYSKNYPKNITLSAKKDPKKIAQDIERRFMPNYLAALSEINKRIAAHNARIARNQRMLMALLDSLDETPKLDYNGEPNWELTEISPHYDFIQSIKHYTDSSTVDLHLVDLPIRIAMNVIELLKDWQPPKPIPLRQLDKHTATKKIEAALEEQFPGLPHEIFYSWNHYTVEIDGKKYDAMSTDDGNIKFVEDRV